MIEESLTKEDYEIAKSNGISYERAYQRFYNSGWSVEDSITKPIVKQPPNLYSQYNDICKNNSISRSCFNKRIKDGMTPEEASTKRTGGRGRKRVFTKEQIAIAESNGISYRLLYMRVHGYTPKWSIERAMTESVHEEKLSRGWR
jgi:hypothetical protein